MSGGLCCPNVSGVSADASAFSFSAVGAAAAAVRAPAAEGFPSSTSAYMLPLKLVLILVFPLLVFAMLEVNFPRHCHNSFNSLIAMLIILTLH
jgi:hypothetical protein